MAGRLVVPIRYTVHLYTPSHGSQEKKRKEKKIAKYTQNNNNNNNDIYV